MPLVQMKVMRGAVGPEERSRLIDGLTEAAASVLGEDIRPYIWVLLEEIGSGDWGIGGRALTTDAVSAMRRGALR